MWGWGLNTSNPHVVQQSTIIQLNAAWWKPMEGKKSSQSL